MQELVTALKRGQGGAFSWLMALLLPAFAVFPALRYPIEEHSFDAATFHVYRGVLFSAARAEGVFFPRWIQPLDIGLGGPLFSFYSPLSYFAMDGLSALGFSHPQAWRILVGLSLLIAATGMFALVLSLSGKAAGALVASVAYVYSFPLLHDLMERGSPEAFSFSLYPWVLWGLVRLIQQPSGFRFAFFSFAWAATILTHHLSSTFLIPMFGLIALLYLRRASWLALGASIAAPVFSLLLIAFFGGPFLAERDFVHLSNATGLDYINIVMNPVPLETLLALPAPYDTGFGNNDQGGPLGPLHGALLATGLLFTPLLWIRRCCREAQLVASFALAALAIVWLQTASANFVWEAFPPLGLLQMRTRLLGLAVLSIAVVVGLLVGVLKERWQPPVSFVLAALAIFLALPILYPQLQHRYTVFSERPTVGEALSFSLASDVPGFTAFNEFLPAWRNLPFTPDEAERVARSLFASLPEGSRVTEESRGNGWAKARLDSSVPFDAVLHVLYYPGWAGYVNGEKRAVKPAQDTGYIVLDGVPAGSHTIELRYEGTPVHLFATLISLAAACGLILIAVFWRGKGSQATGHSYLRPNWGIAAAVLLLVGLKAFWVDPQTTLFRRSSSCADMESGVAGVTAVNVRFGESLALCAIDLPRQVFAPGEMVAVTLYWEARGQVQEPTDSFVHLLGTAINPTKNNPLWGQENKQLPGLHPVTRWTPGKVYRDVYRFPVAADAPPGEYKLEIGWWQPVLGQRLKPELTNPTGKAAVSDLDSLLIPDILVRR